jgi:predicted aminopeptidase
VVSLPGCYLAHVGSSQLGVLWGREPIEEVLQSPRLTPEERQRLELVLEARRYAFEHIELEATGSQSSVYDTGGGPIVWNVSASEPDGFAPHVWAFPLVGAVPYLGYFELGLAVEEARQLKARGLDVALLPVPAYSTLGWFDDPVFSSLLRRSEAELVSTVIHELAHGTVWVPGDVELNENLAQFVGDQGAEDFFRRRGGEEDPALLEAARSREDARLVNAALADLRDDLARVYEASGPRAAKLAYKEQAIAAFRERYRIELRAQLSDDGYDWILRDEIELNNAVLLMFRRYHGDEDVFRALHERCGGDLAATVRALQEIAEADDPRAALEAAAGR